MRFDLAKIYSVSWETKMDTLDDCAIQGPHTLEKAKELRDHFHSRGMKASVIKMTCLERAYLEIQKLKGL